MTLEEQIQKDFIVAFKAKDSIGKRTLGNVKAAISKYKSIPKEATDEAVLGIIVKYAKDRSKGVELYSEQGREDLAIVDKEELDLLSKYLPTKLSEDETTSLLKGLINEVGASSQKDIGKVMGKLGPKKDQIDMKFASKELKKLLS